MTKECYLQDWYFFTAKLNTFFFFPDEKSWLQRSKAKPDKS